MRRLFTPAAGRLALEVLLNRTHTSGGIIQSMILSLNCTRSIRRKQAHMAIRGGGVGRRGGEVVVFGREVAVGTVGRWPLAPRGKRTLPRSTKQTTGPDRIDRSAFAFRHGVYVEQIV